MATLRPLTVAYPMTGPWTVVSNLTGSPASVPALNSCIERHLPLYMYFVSLPLQRVSANWSITSEPAEVSVLAKSGPRPISR